MAWRSIREAPVDTARLGQIGKPIFRFVVCIAAVFAVTAVLTAVPVDRRPLSAALSFLFVVLTVSAGWGFGYSLLVSLLAVLGFSWLLPPVGRFWLSDPRDALVLAALLVIGITTSRLSDRARKEALNANQRRAEAVAAQQRFANLVNSVESIVWEADAETFGFSFVGEQAERILGYPVERWLREPTFWKDHLHPEDRDVVVQFCAQATAEKRSHDFEHRMIAADGRVVWLRNLVTVVAENGRATQLRGVMIDITKRKQDEETLREQANLLSLTHDAIFVRDTNHTIKYWNRGAEEMYGWTAEEASGKASHRLLNTVFPVPLEQIEAELVGAGRWEGELVHTKKDGTPVVVASRWSLQQTNQGTPIAILEINNDITEQKRAEQAREEIEEQWRAAFESNPTMYFIVDAAGAIASVNTFGAEQLGYTVSELAGQPVLNVFYEPDRQAVQRYAKDCFEQPGRMMRWEARKIRKDGSMLWVRETANVVLLRNRPVLLVVCEDITEQKRAEEAARRSESELRDLIENVPAMVFMALPGPSNVFASRGWREYTGLPVDDTAGSGWQTVIHSEDLERHSEEWRVCSTTGEPFEDEARFRSAAHGEYRWFLVRAVSLRDEHGNILKWYGILTDIEDRKRAEALLTGEKRILEMVARGDSLVQILDSLCRLVEEQASGVLTSILLLDGDRLRHGAAPSLPKAYTDAIDGVVIGPSVGSCGTAAHCGEQVIVEDIASDPLWADYREAALPHSLRACWSTPVFSSQGKVIATFAMYYHEPRSPSPRDQEIIEQITHLAGVAIERKLTQEALQRSEAYLAEAQRQTKTGSWAYNPFTGKTNYWSDEMFRIFGLNPQEGSSSEKFWQLVHPEDLGRVKERVEREARDKKEYVDEYRIVLADGTVKHILDIGHPVLNGAGEVAEFVGTTVDVTERKRAEETLRRSEAYLAEAQRLTKTGSWAYDPFTAKTIYWSDEMFRIFGLDPQTGPPATAAFWDRVHPEDRDSMFELMRNAARERTGYEHEHRIVLPDGTIKHIHATGHPVFNGAGDIVEFVGTTVDVTERKRAEEEARASETRFRTSVDHLTDALFIHDDQDDKGRVIDVNQQACDSHGYTRGELIGMTAFDLDPSVDATFNLSIKERLARGEIFSFESTHRRKDGTEFPVEVRVRPFWHGDHRFGLALVRDITDRKRAEAERERLRQLEADLAHMNRVSMMGELAASLAHEIKQPIAAAVTNANTGLRWLARDEPNLEEAREAIMRIVKDGSRAAEIINRLRSFYEKGVPPQPELVDLNELAREMLMLLRNDANRYTIVMCTELAPELPMVMADRVQLQQVFMNLMLNGIEAMKETAGELTIKSQLANDGQLLISVSDTGVGLPADKADQIFNAFFTTKPQGTGMGLAITRSIIEAHGGRLWVSSNSANKRRGATFHFTLPNEVTASSASAG
jgi:PAS domain S-box-containing protein